MAPLAVSKHRALCAEVFVASQCVPVDKNVRAAVEPTVGQFAQPLPVQLADAAAVQGRCGRRADAA